MTYRSVVEEVLQKTLIILRVVELTVHEYTAVIRKRIWERTLSIPELQHRSINTEEQSHYKHSSI